MLRPRRRAVFGSSDERLAPADVRARLAALGAAGEVARELDRQVSRGLVSLTALSEVSSRLAVDYVERVARPIGAMSPEAGARLVVRGYLAHLLVEEQPASFGVDDIPVLGGLPPWRRGRPPQDLLSRVVKATRRQFPAICALPSEVWEGFVTATTGRVHRETPGPSRRAAGRGGAGPGAPPPYLDAAVVDGLLRTGWVLRQVDLAYGMEPERRG